MSEAEFHDWLENYLDDNGVSYDDIKEALEDVDWEEDEALDIE